MISQEDKLIDIKFIDNRNDLRKYIFKKKNWRMRILGAVFFLSLLAGKLATFEQMLLTEKITKYSYYSKFFGGKLKTFKQSITRAKLTKKIQKSFVWYQGLEFVKWISDLTFHILERKTLDLFGTSE